MIYDFIRRFAQYFMQKQAFISPLLAYKISRSFSVMYISYLERADEFSRLDKLTIRDFQSVLNWQGLPSHQKVLLPCGALAADAPQALRKNLHEQGKGL